MPPQTHLDVELIVNGTTHRLLLEPRVSLLDALRERLDLTGTKKGCNQGACGACTVLVDGRRVVSCLTLAVQNRGRAITTIEGISSGENLHPLQQSFIDHDGFQCGYCTPGQICSALGMLDEHRQGTPSAATGNVADTAELGEDEVRERMSGNLCRCAAYNGIVDAILEHADREGISTGTSRESTRRETTGRESTSRESTSRETTGRESTSRETTGTAR